MAAGRRRDPCATLPWESPPSEGDTPQRITSTAMQTLQSFADSLQDPANYAAIREKIQGLPQRFLTKAENQEDYLFGTISGEFNFNFTFRLEGGGFFQSGVLVASAETVPGGMPVPLRCKWKRKINDMLVDIPGVSSNMYQISADDVGTHISVEACPADSDDGLSGAAFGEIGPFELDPATRRCLDNALGMGGTQFVVTQAAPQGDRNKKSTDWTVVVSPESVKLVPARAGGNSDTKEAEYSSDYPKVIIHPLDTCRFEIVMSATHKFQFQAKSRAARDLMALTVRCFHAQKHVPISGILQELFPILPFGNQNSPVKITNHLDQCIVLEPLAMELNKAMVQKDISEKVLRNTHHENRQLRAQLEDTIRACSEAITDAEQAQCSGNTLSTSTTSLSVTGLQKKFEDMEAQNKQLEYEMQKMYKQFDDAARAKKAAEAAKAGPGGGTVDQLREKRDMLKARLQELSSTSGHQRDQADQFHALELKRLRQDVEKLHNEKEDLRRMLTDVENSKQELQENLLYVKGQIDKVHQRQTQKATGESGGDGEVIRFRNAIAAVEDERSRLKMRMDAAHQDLEKEKKYHEASLERLMTSNAKLREEKDRAEKEVERLSKLYADSVKQVQCVRMDSTAEYMADNLQTSGDDEEEVKRLKTQLSQLDESIKKKEQENESLKNRIRKLAVA
mmetsp:Transcript_51692/g.82141  ORF Transcript_51692/g.82141 Transcript_51692/m.82141 type:complete len:679 (-) Transcript_51692:65-2101(-)|eukprot:CAMPEP_0169333730 /NCGR_PEP_ID=MMETSP1017-20121227/15414_1 /TAXON_ID=342587 /ORGANISM="Karlodinium micrum, Strain CCMP2283" /LENGTH=678 /DNA_ID=CAMNT_0009428969 /DNA_START=29 /DNA_END=2065 /DNA_ORIENTATION=+